LIPDPLFARRVLGLLVVGSAAFTLYGSLVPFEFRARDWGEATDSFLWAMQERWWFESRSDAIANVMLGVPLGFGLLGFVRRGSPGLAGDLVAAVCTLPVCVGFAGFVEFAQLFVPERTCSGSDVLCQGVGAAIGMAAWMIAGRMLLVQAEILWRGADSGGRFLVLYLVLLAFVQLLPMDLSASPRDLYRKLRDDVVYVPFSENLTWERFARLLQVFGLFAPVGLLGWRYGRRFLPAVVAIPVVMEGLQLLVKSRTSSATDAFVGASAILLAPALARSRLSSAMLWIVAMIVISWAPFVIGDQLKAFDLTPGLPLERGNPLFALEDVLTKLILFGLLGAIAKPQAVWRAGLLGLALAAVFEIGQTRFLHHSPGITDVLIGGIGAAIGAMVRERAS
jgi:VanZ family protein